MPIFVYMFALKAKYLPQYTYNDYAQWEGDWELIYGVPYSMAPSLSYGHQKTNSRLTTFLNNTLDDCNKCEAIFEFDWKINENTVVRPDLLVVCEPFEKGAFLTKTPDIIFEILSPSTADKDQTLKHDLYEKAGVKYYVIINHQDKVAEIFALKSSKYQLAIKISSGSFHFETSGFSFDFDFGKVW